MQTVTLSHSSDAGQRLDRFIKKYLPNAPLGGIYKMLRTGKIKVNGKKKDQTYKLEEGDELSFWISDEEIAALKKGEEGIHEKSTKKTDIPLEVLYEDEYLMVVNKPSDMNVHPGDHKTEEVSLIDLVQDMLAGKYDSLTFKPALVHRIDRDTSGCILIAKEKSTLESLLESLQSHAIEKIYHTIVVGIPREKEGTIRAKLLRIENAKNEAKVRVDETGQSAVTHYKVLASNEKHSLIECRIETGRTHQIRVHLASIGHPVLGDTAYGDKRMNSFMKREKRIHRQLLHARSLVFVHPKTKKRLRVEAPYREDMNSLILEYPQEPSGYPGASPQYG